MNRLSASLAAIFALSGAPTLANPGDGWILIAQDTLRAGEKTYIHTPSIEDWGDGQYYAASFTVYPVTLRGFEMAGPDDSWTNTDYPHRSMMEWAAYDCPRQLIGVTETNYFSGERLSRDNLVYMEKVGNPLLFPDYLGDPVLAFVCR